MRFPVTPQISTKDGVSAKNARLTNCLKESKKGGDKAVIRPGLVLDAQASGVGNGLVVFNNELVSVYGATLGFGVTPGSGATSIEYPTNLDSGQGVVADFVSGHYVQYFLGFSDEIWIGAYWADEYGWALFFPSYNDQTGDTPVMTATTDNYHFVAVEAGDYGSENAVWRVSLTDLLVWPPALSDTHGRSLAAATYQMQSLRYLNGLLIAITSTSAGSEIYYSSDEGDTWASITDAAFRARDVLWDGSTYRIYGSDLTITAIMQKTTTDFSSLSSAVTMSGTLPTEFLSCGYIGGGYVGSGNSKRYTSSDGIAWAQLSDVTFTDDRIRCKIISPYLYTSYTPSVGVSGVVRTSNGSDWELIASTPDFSIEEIATNGTSTLAWSFDNLEYLVALGAEDVGTIPALATITGDYYDFAQSPI